MPSSADVAVERREIMVNGDQDGRTEVERGHNLATFLAVNRRYTSACPNEEGVPGQRGVWLAHRHLEPAYVRHATH